MTGGPQQQRHACHGAGSLAVLLVLLLAASITLLYANRALIFEQRAAANLLRSAVALEAAEAGLAWTLAWLNHTGRVDAQCRPSSPATFATDSRFAARYLALDATSGTLTPVASARPACVADGAGGWTCDCPAAGNASLTAPTGDGEFPAFAIEFSAGPRPGTVRLRIDGCSGVSPACGAAPQAADASARTEVLLAALSAVARAPYAALTARGTVTLQGAAELVNTEGNGLTVSSAAAITADSAVQSVTVPGHDSVQSMLATDPTWLVAGSSTAVSAERFFAAHFALDKPSYRALPMVQTLRCAGGCTGTDVAAALATGSRALWIEGGLALAGPLSAGSAAEPLVLVVDGPLTVIAPVAIHGLVYAGSVAWAGSSALGGVTGALLSEDTAQVAGRVRLLRDAGVLSRLQFGLGAFAPVAGSWRDTGD